MSLPLRRRATALVAALAAVAAGTLAVRVAPPSARAAATAGSDVRVVGTLSRYPADVAAALGVTDLEASSESATDGGVALIAPERDRLYQLWNVTKGPKAGHLAIAERDLASLALLRVATVKDRQAAFTPGDAGTEWFHTFDRKGGRLYVMYRSRGGLSGAPGAASGQNLPGLLGVDLATMAVTDTPLPRIVTETADTLELTVGMEYDEGTDTLLLLQASNLSVTGSANVVGLVGWKGDALRKGGELPPATPRVVRSCRRDPINNRGTRRATPIMVADAPDLQGDRSVKSFVMFPCFSTTASANVVIARMERASALDPQSRQEQAIVAPASIVSWEVDSAHGRMYLVNDSSETDTWVYEAASNAFVGVIEMSPKGKYVAQAISLGVDEASGRLYARAEGNGLMISAAAQDPVPQADVFPALAAKGAYRILVDGARDRIFSLTGNSIGTGASAKAYEIIAVPTPLSPPPPEDPDQRTLQVDEQPGVTEVQYGGAASAYGLRALFARGFAGAVPSNGNADAGAAYRDINSYCGFGDREVVLAGIPKTEMSDLSKFATAAGVQLDNATVIDLKNPTRCDVYNQFQGPFFPLTAVLPALNTTGAFSDSRNPAGQRAASTVNGAAAPRTSWDYEPADCTKPGGTHRAGTNSAQLAGPTKVDCTKADEISAAAAGRIAGASSPVAVEVGRATSSTKVKLDPKLGLVSTATARVDGVRLADLSIGFVEHTASSYARGRTGTAKTQYGKPRIGYVEAAGQRVCTDSCDIDAVIRQVNPLIAGRAELRRPAPEVRLAAGSPGGYEAGIIKSQKQQASDSSLSGDKSVEIPALELVVYNDNPVVGRARQVIQLAGVRVDSHYGIQARRDGEPCADCGSIIDVTEVLGDLVGIEATTFDDALGALSFGTDPTVATAPSGPATPVTRFFRQAVAGAVVGLRLLFQDPREALALATAWALLAAPLLAARRRQALRSLTRTTTGGPTA